MIVPQRGSDTERRKRDTFSSLTTGAVSFNSVSAGGRLTPSDFASLSAEAGALSAAGASVRRAHCLEEQRLIGKLGRYTVLGQIANGGMGSVFIAQMLGPAAFSRLVAIKCLHSRWLEDAECVSRFTLEAKLAASIHHPNVVQTLDVVDEGGELFLVMEYVDGVTLAALLTDLRRAQGALPVGMALGILSAVLRGLHAAHGATDRDGVPLHVVHRDVSPQNILLDRNGHVRLLDFGAAKSIDSQHTSAGKLVGKVAYMAPEQMSGESLRPSADVFSAGVVLWEALIGRRLFHSSQVDRSDRRHARTPVPRPSRLRSEVPSAVDKVVEKALAQSPEQRFQTALEFAIALESIGGVPSATDLARLISEACAERLAKNDAWLRSALAEAAEASESTRIFDPLPSTPPPSFAGVALPRAPRPPRQLRIAGLGVVLLVGGAFSWAFHAGLGPEPSQGATLLDSRSGPTLAAAHDPEPEQRNPPGRRDVTESYAAVAPPDLHARESEGFASATAAAMGTLAVGFMTAGELQPAPTEPLPLRREERRRGAARETKPRSARASTPALLAVPRASSACDTPTYIDGAGIRHFKEDCL